MYPLNKSITYFSLSLSLSPSPSLPPLSLQDFYLIPPFLPTVKFQMKAELCSTITITSSINKFKSKHPYDESDVFHFA